MNAVEREMTNLALNDLLAVATRLLEAVEHLQELCSQPAEPTAAAREGTVKEPGVVLMTVEEIAEAYRMGPRRVRALIDAGELPIIPFGRRIMIDRADMDGWVLRQKVMRTR